MRNWQRFVLIAVVVVMLALLFVIYYRSRTSVVSGSGIDSFLYRLNAVVLRETAFAMSEATDFEWDTMYVFPPYTSRDEMERTVGAQWTPAGSPLGGWLHRSALGKYPLDDDSVHKLVFVKEGRVVLDVTLNRATADFTPVKETVARDRSGLLVDRTEDGRVVIRSDAAGGEG